MFYSRPSPIVSWLVILGSAVAIMAGNAYLLSVDTESGEASALVILKMQAKILTAADRVAPGTASRELANLSSQGTTPAIAHALACLEAALDSGDGEGRARARELLARHRDELFDGEDIALNNALNAAVEDPDDLGPTDRQLVEDRMGWFGRLLLTRGSDPSEPERARLLGEARRALAALFGVVALAVLGTVGGLVVFGIGLYRFKEGMLERRFVRSRAYPGVYLRAFAVYVLGFFVLQMLPALLGIPLGPGAYLGLLIASVSGVLWPLLYGVPRRVAFRDLGLYRGRGVLAEIGSGLVGYVGILPIVAAGFLVSILLIFVWQAIHPPSPDEPPQLISHPVVVLLAEGGTAVRLAILFLASGFAPLFEETMFRGALFADLRRRFGPVVSGLLMGLIFAIVHPQGILLVPALASLAFGFALLREWRGSLIAPMVAHAVHNGTLVCFMWIVFG